MEKLSILIPMSHLPDGMLELMLYELTPNTLHRDDSAQLYGESPYQLMEGKRYEYELNDAAYILEKSPLIRPSLSSRYNGGCIETGLNVGLFKVGILARDTRVRVAEVELEIRSCKASYREDYRVMLQDITAYCTELLMDQNSAVDQHFCVDEYGDPKLDYQRFAFIQSIVDSSSFQDALLRIQREPVHRWQEERTQKRVSQLKRVNAQQVRQLVKSGHRMPLPPGKSIAGGLRSVPRYVEVQDKRETNDVVENQFIRFVLEQFLAFSSGILRQKKASERLKKEADLLNQKLQQALSQPLFRRLSRLKWLPLNSPILQRKEGYREVLQVWLMFDMAAKLTWEGGDDVYSAGKKNVALLYEYWVFFKLMEVISQVFKLQPKEMKDLIRISEDKLSLALKQGRMLVLSGKYEMPTRVLNVAFTYNKTFTANENYESAGSWTRNMRPDYTLSLWPGEIGAADAERQELMVHIHFDAKYRIEHLILQDKVMDAERVSEALLAEKEEEAAGKYKRDDLLKMHAYKDAIRRSAGAYIIYPGTLEHVIKGYHEVIPGLGAFALSPSGNGYASNLPEFKAFLHDVVDNFLNRTSQREELAYRRYEVLQKRNDSLMEPLPENVGENRGFLPDETQVLVGYYKNEEHLAWILKHHLYNTRTDSRRGSLHLDSATVSARYVLLHSKGETQTSLLYRLDGCGPRLFSAEQLVKKGYEAAHGDFYLVFSLLGEAEKEFANLNFDVTQLENYHPGRTSALPFTAPLHELMRCRC